MDFNRNYHNAVDPVIHCMRCGSGSTFAFTKMLDYPYRLRIVERCEPPPGEAEARRLLDEETARRIERQEGIRRQTMRALERRETKIRDIIRAQRKGSPVKDRYCILEVRKR